MSEAALEGTKVGLGIATFPVTFLPKFLFTPVDPNNPMSSRINKLLLFFVISSLLTCVFVFGGIITIFVAIIYAYTIIFKKIKCLSNNVSQEDCEL